MSMLDWAKREVEIACKRENPERKEGEWDYGCACYESALKAFESLCEDGHSGFSIGLTKNILNRLIDGKPLTPIEDTDDNWRFSFDEEDGTKVYQCKRMGALFKHVYQDGSVTYDSNDRFVGVHVNSPNICFGAKYIRKIMEEVVGPITMPYMPESEPYYVYCEDFLFDPKMGDFDTVGLLYYIAPDGERKDLDIYLAYKGEPDMVRIAKEEYLKRKAFAEQKKGK